MTQGERITKIETQVDYIKDDVTEIKIMLSKHMEKQDAFLTVSEARKSYAPIWTEWGTKALIAFYIGTIFSYILNKLV